MGLRNPDAYRTESALDPLRNRPDFRALMMDLVFPTEPFARRVRVGSPEPSLTTSRRGELSRSSGHSWTHRFLNINTSELVLNIRKYEICEYLFPTIPRGNTLPGCSASPRVPCRPEAKPTRSVEEGIPTPERGNENKSFPLLHLSPIPRYCP